MQEETIHSSAFHYAALKSEAYRVTGLLCLLGAVAIFVIARAIFTTELFLFVAQFVVLAAVITHEIHMLRRVRAALRNEAPVETDSWILNVFVESQIPTVGLFLLLASGLLNPFQVLVAPVVVLYFILIALSTLRLSPSTTAITGILSSMGYLLVTFYTVLRFQNSEAKEAAFPLSVYFIYAGLILAAGVVAAFVTAQIRGHVIAALREAEFQKEYERITHDLDIARSIQEGLLPATAPKLERFDIAGWNKPADLAGGDYFDWQALPDGHLAISLGDATGHGIGPALVSASCRAYARASFLAGDWQNGLLDRLNRLLADDLSSNRFVTFAVAFLDPSNSHVRVLSAGHGPILWYKYAANEITELEAQGIPLGMIPGVKYSPGKEVCLASGDLLVLVTNGFYEWTNDDGEEFGLTRLKRVIGESCGYSSEEIIARLRSVVTEFCGGTKRQDDLTVVIVKRRMNHR